MTNSFLIVSLAYKLAISSLMLADANRIAQELDLPCKKPILMAEIKKPFVRHPDLSVEGKPDFGGLITSSNFTFSFIRGRCWKIVRLNLFPNGKPYQYVNPLPYLADLTRAPFKVSTNGAYSLATNWLTRFKTNVPELEAKYKPVVYQLEYLSGEGEKLKTAIYYVQWGPGSDGVVKVGLLGTTGELMDLTVDDESFNHQPPINLPNWKELMARAEKKLQKPSDEKTNKPSLRPPG